MCHLAGVFAKSLKEKIDKDAEKLLLKQRVQDAKHYEFDEREVLCVQLAGLCHDLGNIIGTCMTALIQLLYSLRYTVVHQSVVPLNSDFAAVFSQHAVYKWNKQK